MTKHMQHKTNNIMVGTMAAILGLAGASGSAAPVSAKDAGVDINVNVGDVLSLSIYPTGDHAGAEASRVSLEPIPGGPLVTNSIDAVVKTNVEVGYQLNLRNASDDSSLINAKNNEKIPTLEHEIEADYFPTGYYGYSTDGKSFFGVPTLSSAPAILRRTTNLVPNAGESTTVTFGVKVGNTKPGEYSTSVVFTASPELAPVAPADMSEWTPGLYWDNNDLEGLYTWSEATVACQRKGKRLPSDNEYRSLLTTQNITNDTTGSEKIRSEPYNFRYGIGSEYGEYWSSTFLDDNNHNNGPNSIGWDNSLYFHSGSVYIYTEHSILDNTTMGVRCVKDKE